MADLAIWNSWESALVAIAALVVLYLAAMWLAAILWTYRDIKSRTADPYEQAASVLLVAVFNIPGLVLHVLMRPKATFEEQMDRRLEAEAMFQDIQEHTSCPQCATRVQSDFIICPLCRAQLRTPCSNCGEALAVDWVMCPFCTADRPLVAASAGHGRTVGPRRTGLNGAPRPAFAGGRPRS